MTRFLKTRRAMLGAVVLAGGLIAGTVQVPQAGVHNAVIGGSRNGTNSTDPTLAVIGGSRNGTNSAISAVAVIGGSRNGTNSAMRQVAVIGGSRNGTNSTNTDPTA